MSTDIHTKSCLKISMERLALSHGISTFRRPSVVALRFAVFFCTCTQKSAAVSGYPESAVSDDVSKSMMRRVHHLSLGGVFEQMKGNKSVTEGRKELKPTREIWERSLRAGQSEYLISMPRTFTRAMGDKWKSYMWQVRTGRFAWSVLQPQSQLTNVFCHDVHVREINISSSGDYGQITHIDLNLSSTCMGEYCWKSWGYASFGQFRSNQNGTLQLVFPGHLPEVGEPGRPAYLHGYGDDGGWCNIKENSSFSDSDFRNEIEYNPSGAMHYLERDRFKDNTIWLDEMCRTIRRKVQAGDEKSEKYQVPAMESNFPTGPLVVVILWFVLNFFICTSAYKYRWKQFEQWQEDYVKTYKPPI